MTCKHSYVSPVGSVPATGFLKQSGIHMDSKGFITVNKVFHKSFSLSGRVVPYFSTYTFKLLPDDADKCWRGLCWRRRGNFSFSSKKQQEGEHSSLANGSCTRWVCYCVPKVVPVVPMICGPKDKQCLLVLNLNDRKSSSSQHDGESHWYQNCALLLVSHVWEDHTLCR